MQPISNAKAPAIFRGMEKFCYAMTIDLSTGNYSMTSSKENLCHKLTLGPLPIQHVSHRRFSAENGSLFL
jgi:hypothetical protein